MPTDPIRTTHSGRISKQTSKSSLANQALAAKSISCSMHRKASTNASSSRRKERANHPSASTLCEPRCWGSSWSNSGKGPGSRTTLRQTLRQNLKTSRRLRLMPSERGRRIEKLAEQTAPIQVVPLNAHIAAIAPHNPPLHPPPQAARMDYPFEK